MLHILITEKYTQKELPEKIKNLLMIFVMYDEFEFLVREKDFSKIGKKNNICINAFCYENKLVSAIYIADQNLETQWICCL